MHENDEQKPPLTPELAEAHREVELAKAELQRNLHDVRDSGRRALVRMAKNAKPVLLVAAVVLGALVVARIARSRARRKRRNREPSVFGVLARAALRGAAQALAARAAEQAAARLVLATTSGERDDGASDEPAPAPLALSNEGFVHAPSTLASCVSTSASK